MKKILFTMNFLLTFIFSVSSSAADQINVDTEHSSNSVFRPQCNPHFLNDTINASKALKSEEKLSLTCKFKLGDQVLLKITTEEAQVVCKLSPNQGRAYSLLRDTEKQSSKESFKLIVIEISPEPVTIEDGIEFHKVLGEVSRSHFTLTNGLKLYDDLAVLSSTVKDVESGDIKFHTMMVECE